MRLHVVTAQLMFWGIGSLGAQDYFDVSPPQPDMKIADCAFQSGRFYFLFTKAGSSELVVTDLSGRVTAHARAKNPANHIYPNCSTSGPLTARPTRNGTTTIETYSTDLAYTRTFEVQDEFVGGLCLPAGFTGIGSGAIHSVDAASGAVRSRTLALTGDDPLLVAQGARDSFVVLQLFTGTLLHVDSEGRVKHQALLAGPELNRLRALRGADEGLFAPAIATDGTGVFVILGRHSSTTGLRLQKYTFDGQYVTEWRLPHLTFEEFRKPRRADRMFSNSSGSLLIGRLFVSGGFAYVVDTVNGRVVRFNCGKLCGG